MISKHVNDISFNFRLFKLKIKLEFLKLELGLLVLVGTALVM